MKPFSRSMPVLQIHIIASTQAAFFLTPLVAEIAGRGVHIQGAPEGMWSLKALIAKKKWHPRVEKRLQDACNRLSKYFGKPSAPKVRVSELPLECRPPKGEKRFFRPFPATRRVVVCPPDRMVPTLPGQTLLSLEVDQVRGTGIHPATRCSLRLLEHLASRESFGHALDVETGTGILAMAAARFGVAGVSALDRDPRAVEVARKNVVRNHLRGSVTLSCRDINTEGGTYPLVMVQFSMRAIKKRRIQLQRCLVPGGWIILGGIWWKRRHEILSPLLDRLQLTGADREAWWGSVLLRKPFS